MTDPRDLSMLELFRQEIEAQTAILTEGLLALERDPSGRRVESLMRAAHSMKGAARIVDLGPAVALTHAMEDVFESVKGGRLELEAEDVDLLLSGVDLLSQLGAIGEPDISGWLATRSAAFEELARAIGALPGREPTAEPAAPEDVPATRALRRANPRSGLGPPSSPWEHFRHELGVQVARLGSLEIAPGRAEDLEEMLRATRLARGASLIVGCLPAARLTTALGDRLAAALEGSVPLPPDQVALVGEAVEALGEIAGIAEEDSGRRLAELEAALAALGERLEASRGGEAAAAGPRPGPARSAIEDHAVVLATGIEDLRKDPGATRRLEALRLAAGAFAEAAEAMGVSEGAALARALERTFASARDGRRPVGVEQVPILASAAEELRGLARTVGPAAGPLKADQTQRLAGLVAELEAPAAPAVRSGPPAPAQPRRDRFVRITADNLERLMGLAGEALVQVNWLQPYADSLAAIRRSQARLAGHLERLRELAAATDPRGPAAAILRAAAKEHAASRESFSDRLVELEDYARRSVQLSNRLYHEVIGSRMRPFADGIHSFARMVRDLGRRLGKKVELEVVGVDTPVDRDILDRLEAPLTHLVRNAIDHGLESPEAREAAGKPATGTIRIEARHRAGQLSIQVSDDGRGIDADRLRQAVVERGLAAAETASQLGEAELHEFLFLPGFSTAREVTEISGRGAGLDAVRSMVGEVGGSLRLSSRAGRGTTFHLQLPLTLSVIRTLLVEIAGEPYAFPLTRIDRVLRLEDGGALAVQGSPYLAVGGRSIGLVEARRVLELDSPIPRRDDAPVVVVSDERSLYGLVVDDLLGEHELVVRPLDSRLGKVQDVSAGALLPDGSLVLILDVDDLLRSIDRLLGGGPAPRLEAPSGTIRRRARRILVVDDSITIRELERRLLANRGYDVETAVDGADAWHALSRGGFDLVVSDIDMPRMTGLELLERVRSDPDLARLPFVIVSYKDREEDRRRGLEAGASLYLTKRDVDEAGIVDAVADLIGEARA